VTVKAILEAKGHDVCTLGPNEKLSEAVRLLAEHRIGALVITNGDRKIVGILSERDIVRVIARDGGAALDTIVRDVMTPKVNICNENHTVNEVMEIMTAAVSAIFRSRRTASSTASSPSATWSSGASRMSSARPRTSAATSRLPDLSVG
jgi:CBS domain-containing protein